MLSMQLFNWALVKAGNFCYLFIIYKHKRDIIFWLIAMHRSKAKLFHMFVHFFYRFGRYLEKHGANVERFTGDTGFHIQTLIPGK